MENSEQPGVTPGEMLRTAREALGISSREMADRLNWLPVYLMAVEENRFEVLRGAAFARGYLCAYAKQVDIPESVCLAAFEALQAAELPGVEDDVEVKSESPLKKPEVGIALGLACAVLLITGLWWWQSTTPQKPALSVTNVSEQRVPEAAPEQPATSDELLVAAAEQFAATEAALEESALEEADAEVADAALVQAEVVEAEVADAAVVQAAVAEAGVAEAEVAEAGVAEAEVALEPALSSPAEDTGTGALIATAETPLSGIEGVESDAMLQFRFSGDCWVEIRDGNDVLIYADLHRGGDTLNMDGLPPFNITLGDSRTVELRYQGEPILITPRRGRVLARLTVGAP